MSDQCHNCGIENDSFGYWCSGCRYELSDIDKWYLVGFLGLCDQPHPNGMSDFSAEGAAYRLGRKDRLGEKHDEPDFAHQTDQGTRTFRLVP